MLDLISAARLAEILAESSPSTLPESLSMAGELVRLRRQVADLRHVAIASQLAEQLTILAPQHDPKPPSDGVGVGG